MHPLLRALVSATCGLAALVPARAGGEDAVRALPGRLHIELESAQPAPDDTIDTAPAALRLRFTAFIEPAYTSLTLTGPAGDQVVTGRIVFVEGSDREFTAAVPPLVRSGVYRVSWRTAGADGHVLEGSYSFTLLALLADTTTVPPAPVPAAGAEPGTAAHDHGTGAAQAAGPLSVLGRFLHFSALTILLGGLAFRTLLLPRLELVGDTRAELVRRAWRVVAAGAVLLAGAAVLRLWLQSVALHGAERAWNTPLLSMMLTDTSWGRAWVLQVFLFAVLGAAIVRARPHRDVLALAAGVPAAIGLAAIPGLTGHAAGLEQGAFLVLANDTLHVLAVGVWIGTLLLLLGAATPALLRRPNGQVAAIAAAVHAFSPIALAAAAVLVLTGAINALLHVRAPADLVSTDYGRTLLVKIGLVIVVAFAGLVNWRVVRPRLVSLEFVRRLRYSMTLELVLAAFVLLVTSYLTGLPR